VSRSTILAGLVVTAATLCNIVNQGFVGGSVGVFVELFNRSWNAQSASIVGWFGSVATAFRLGMGE